MEMKVLLEKLSEALDSPDASDAEIKVAISLEKMIDTFFTPENETIGRNALRKVLTGKQDNLSVNEHKVLSSAFIKLLPILANNRTLFNRLSNALV